MIKAFPNALLFLTGAKVVIIDFSRVTFFVFKG